jgi:type IV pilus assembly protein PilB
MAMPAGQGSRRPRRTKQLGEILVERGLILQEDLDRALQRRAQTGQLLGRILIDMNLIRETDLVAALAAQIGLEFVELADETMDPTVAALIPEQLARRYRALPIGYRDDRLVVAMADPSNLFAVDDIRTITGLEVQPVVATAADIEQAIRKYSQSDESVQQVASEAALAADERETELDKLLTAVEDAPIVRMVNLLISQAIAERASDIHIEPTQRDVRIRNRVDGVLHEVMRSPRNIHAALISRLKVMADLNIAERRLPQDGRVGLTVGGKTIDLRVASLPTVYGEKIVIRILDKGAVLLKLEELGFLPGSFTRYEESFTKPYGAILVTGPTGSGKSTSLYATLNILNKADRNIITVEDPVEYRLPGINQMQMNPRAGLTFASALRSILRADPDILLVGEIRDRETALIAIEAALTGHLVLSTLHTNDAPSALPRLIEMGVEPYLVASAIDCVVAQRLARKLCVKCRVAYKPETPELVNMGFSEEDIAEIETLYRASGCSACAKTGYYGRIGVYEVLRMTEEIERLTADRVSSDQIRQAALRDGMHTLRQDGLQKIKAGMTSIEEVLRVVA